MEPAFVEEQKQKVSCQRKKGVRSMLSYANVEGQHLLVTCTHFQRALELPTLQWRSPQSSPGCSASASPSLSSSTCIAGKMNVLYSLGLERHSDRPRCIRNVSLTTERQQAPDFRMCNMSLNFPPDMESYGVQSNAAGHPNVVLRARGLCRGYICVQSSEPQSAMNALTSRMAMLPVMKRCRSLSTASKSACEQIEAPCFCIFSSQSDMVIQCLKPCRSA